MMGIRLRCEVGPGQFSREYAVAVRGFDGRAFSLFADRDDVECARTPAENQTVDGWLSVEVVRKGDVHHLVRLPQATLEGGQILSVRPSQLAWLPRSERPVDGPAGA